MKALFVDTSAWYPLADPGHAEHGAVAAALRVRVREGVAIVTTNLVVAETQALLLSRKGRSAALAFLDAIGQPPNRIEYVDSEREAAAIDRWIRRFSEQSFSLADAASFEVMTELGIEEALTLDRHFGTAGFLMVPGG